MNTPYVKEYNEEGIVSNPIKEVYTTKGDNRRQRRAVKQKSRFFGNGKQARLVVHKNGRYKKVVQYVMDNDSDKINRIEHYILCK